MRSHISMLLVLWQGAESTRQPFKTRGEKPTPQLSIPTQIREERLQVPTHKCVNKQNRWKDRCAEPEAFFLAFMQYKSLRNARGLLATSLIPNTSHCLGVQVLHIPPLPPPSLPACRHPKGDRPPWHKNVAQAVTLLWLLLIYP